jgi:hypothetical protein
LRGATKSKRGVNRSKSGAIRAKKVRMWANVFAPRLTYLDGDSSRASLLKNIANTQIICDEFIFLEIGQYILSKRNNAGSQIRKIKKLIIFIITPFFGGTHDLFSRY